MFSHTIHSSGGKVKWAPNNTTHHRNDVILTAVICHLYYLDGWISQSCCCVVELSCCYVLVFGVWLMHSYILPFSGRRLHISHPLSSIIQTKNCFIFGCFYCLSSLVVYIWVSFKQKTICLIKSVAFVGK